MQLIVAQSNVVVKLGVEACDVESLHELIEGLLHLLLLEVDAARVHES